MEVRVIIPDDLQSRFSYIPEKALPDIIIDLLRKGLQVVDKKEYESEIESNSKQTVIDMEAILSAIKELQIPIQSKSITEEEIDNSAIEIQSYQPTFSAEEDDDDELGDFLDLLK